jgi:FixJ family two-component response regulator
MRRITIHIVDDDSRARAEHARIVLMLGHHAEVYSSIDELLDRPPASGVTLARQRTVGRHMDELFAQLGEESIPVLIVEADPATEQIVAAIRSGALDYLRLPIEPGQLACSLSRVLAEAEVQARRRRRRADARRRIGGLSGREREVLEWLALGSSNKTIGRELGISPRTVEIHRGNMMAKLGARHAAEAIRLWLQADLESSNEPGARSVADKRDQRPHGPIPQRGEHDEHQHRKL